MQDRVAANMLGAALGLTMLPVTVFALASLYLLAGRSIEFISASVILTLSALTALVLAHRTGGWISPVLVVVVVLGAAVASHFGIDTSWDGQRYHYDATRALADGWNPYREAFQTRGPFQGQVASDPWPQFYPMAAWLASAVPIAVGIDIESAKLSQLILMVALLFSAFGAGVTFGLNRLQALALAICIAGNPIIIAQAFTRMNDGLLACCLGLCAVFSALWLRNRSSNFIITALGIMSFGLNLKFSAIPLFVIFCGLIVVVAWLALGRARAIHVGAALLVGGVVGIFLLGAHPYVTNTLEHQHPFYPVYGPNPIDIITMNRPTAFADLSEVERLARSYFGPTSNALYTGGGSYKWPFTISSDELHAAGAYDSRLAGFGPLFSGAMLIALTLGVLIAVVDRTRARLIALGAIGTLLLVSIAMPEAWWARYVPQLWWIAPLLAAVGFASPRLSIRVGGWVLTALALANIGIVTAASAQRVSRETGRVQDQIAQIANQGEPICVLITSSHARLELLLDADIDVVIEQGAPSGSLTPLYLAGVGNNPSYTPCLPAGSASSAPTSFTATFTSVNQLSPPRNSQISVTTSNVGLRLQGYVPNASTQLRTEGASVALDAASERVFAGRRVRVTFRARGVDGATEFTAAYSTHGNGNSGWQTLRLTSELSDVSFDYDVPMGVFGGNDFVGIMPPVTGAVEIQSIRVAQ